jgi:hypothetical protein
MHTWSDGVVDVRDGDQSTTEGNLEVFSDKRVLGDVVAWEKTHSENALRRAWGDAGVHETGFITAARRCESTFQASVVHTTGDTTTSTWQTAQPSRIWTDTESLFSLFLEGYNDSSEVDAGLWSDVGIGKGKGKGKTAFDYDDRIAKGSAIVLCKQWYANISTFLTEDTVTNTHRRNIERWLYMFNDKGQSRTPNTRRSAKHLLSSESEYDDDEGEQSYEYDLDDSNFSRPSSKTTNRTIQREVKSVATLAAREASERTIEVVKPILEKISKRILNLEKESQYFTRNVKLDKMSGSGAIARRTRYAERRKSVHAPKPKQAPSPARRTRARRRLSVSEERDCSPKRTVTDDAPNPFGDVMPEETPDTRRETHTTRYSRTRSSTRRDTIDTDVVAEDDDDAEDEFDKTPPRHVRGRRSTRYRRAGIQHTGKRDHREYDYDDYNHRHAATAETTALEDVLALGHLRSPNETTSKRPRVTRTDSSHFNAQNLESDDSVKDCLSNIDSGLEPTFPSSPTLPSATVDSPRRGGFADDVLDFLASDDHSHLRGSLFGEIPQVLPGGFRAY